MAEGGRVDLDLDFTSEQQVEVVALDTFIVSRGIPQPDYLKVDVDGSELRFIEGATATLRLTKLKGVMFELQTRDQGYGDIMAILTSCGLLEYSRHEIEPDLFNVWFRRKLD